MSTIKAFSTLAAAGVLLFSVSEVVDSADWLGQCADENGEPTGNPEAVEQQKCLNLHDCDPTGDNICRTILADICPADFAVMEASKKRSIQLGDCESAGTTDECFECTNSLICYVEYLYEFKNGATCINRCAEPSDLTASTTAKCKP